MVEKTWVAASRMRWWRCWLRSCSAGTRFSRRKPTDSSVGFLQDSVPEAHDPRTSKFRLLGEEASSWRRTSLLVRDSPPKEGLSARGGTLLLARDSPLRERLSSSGETFLLRWDIPPGEGLSSSDGTFLLGRDSPPGEGLSSWGGTLLLGRDSPPGEGLSSSGETFLFGRDFPLREAGDSGGQVELRRARLVVVLPAGLRAVGFFARGVAAGLARPAGR